MRPRIKHEVYMVVNLSYDKNDVPILDIYDYSDKLVSVYVTGKIEFFSDSKVYNNSQFEYVISHIIRSYIDCINETDSNSDRYLILEKLKRDIPDYEKLLSGK